MKHLAIALTLAVLLAGCADQPPKDAVIEDRGIKAAPGLEAAQSIDTRGVPRTSVESKPIPSQAGTVDGAPGQPGSGKVETRGLAEATTEVKPMDASQAGAATAAGDQAAIALILKDPDSPLSKRIIQFDFDSSAIRDEYRGLLEAHAEFLKNNPASKVILQGHADERGSREYNLALGQRRAESVFKAMSLLGVPETQMEAVSLGEEKPIAEGHDEAAWQQNRRTEILYQGE